MYKRNYTGEIPLFLYNKPSSFDQPLRHRAEPHGKKKMPAVSNTLVPILFCIISSHQPPF